MTGKLFWTCVVVIGLAMDCGGLPSKQTSEIVFEGELLVVGPPPPFASGYFSTFRLAKYRVLQVCKGNYSGSEIVVDHPAITLKEFDGVDVGDKLWITVSREKKIASQHSAVGIRESSERPREFFIARGLQRTTRAGCSSN